MSAEKNKDYRDLARTAATRRNGGFTLIELMVVLLITQWGRGSRYLGDQGPTVKYAVFCLIGLYTASIVLYGLLLLAVFWTLRARCRGQRMACTGDGVPVGIALLRPASV